MAEPETSPTSRSLLARLEGEWLPWLESAVLVLGAVMITGLIGLHVGARWGGFSMRWTEEAARLVTLWATFFAVPIYLRHRRLLAVDYALTLMPVRMRAVIQLCIYILIAVVSVFLVVIGYRLALLQWTATSPGLTWPMTVFSLPIPIVSALMLLHLVPLLRDEVRVVIHGESALPPKDDLGAGGLI